MLTLLWKLLHPQGLPSVGSVALGFFSPHWVFIFAKVEHIFSAFSAVIDE